MTAYNVVRFKVKTGMEKKFLDAHKDDRKFAGFKGGSLIKTGDRTYCLVGQWKDFDAMVKARPQMIALLDTFRDTLEDLGGGLGVTDPVSGNVVAELPASKT